MFFVLLQILVFNNISISSLEIMPFIYLILIMLLPFETPGWLLIITSFFIGLSIDISQDTGGAHAAASVFAAFVRPAILSVIAPRDGYESGSGPTVLQMGANWFIKYSLSIIIIHQLVFIYLEAFTFSGFFYSLLKVLLISITTFIAIFLSQFLIFRK